MNCEFCAEGFVGYPWCQLRPTHSYAWRLVGLTASPSQSWHVLDVSMHQGKDCDEVSMLARDGISEYVATTSLQDLGPDRAFDSKGVRTAWTGMCNSTECGEGAEGPWLGIILRQAMPVACIRLAQGNGEFGVDAVALERWHGDNATARIGEWQRVRSWDKIIRRTSAAGVVELFVTCDGGMPMGGHTVHDCDTRRSPWDECVVQCEEGYVGTATVFICDDTYTFRGVLPFCEPKECTEGIPVSREIAAEDCVGRRTDETCVAYCVAGYVGEEVTYVCDAKGALVHEKTRQAGVKPFCTENTDVLLEAAHATSLLEGVANILSIAVTFVLLMTSP